MRAAQQGVRLLTWSLLGLLVLLAVAVLLSEGPPPEFRGGPVLLRPWMHIYNQVVVAAHLLVLVPLTIGAQRAITTQSAAALAWKRAGVTTLVFASVASLALVVFQAVVATEPITADGVEMRCLRVLVFFPPTGRSAALAAFVLALPFQNQHRWRRVFALAYAAADLLVCVARWAQTESAVTATLHPAADELVLLLPAAGLPLMMIALLPRPTSTPPTSTTRAPHG